MRGGRRRSRLKNRLAWEKLETESQKKTIRCRDEEVIRLCGKLRELRDICGSPSGPRTSEGTAEGAVVTREGGGAFEVAVPCGRGTSQGPGEVAASEDGAQMSRENGRLCRALRKSETRRARLEVELAKLRATGAVPNRAQERTTGEGVGAQARRAARARHGRTLRPRSMRGPSSQTRVCAGCGQPYVANGARMSSIVRSLGLQRIRRPARGARARVSHGSVGAACASPVRGRLSATPASAHSIPGIRGHAGRRHAPLHAAVRARAVASREGRSNALLGLLPRRPLAERRCRDELFGAAGPMSSSATATAPTRSWRASSTRAVRATHSTPWCERWIGRIALRLNRSAGVTTPFSNDTPIKKAPRACRAGREVAALARRFG